MKKKQIIATLTAAMCCMGTVSIPSMTMVSAAESAGITAQTADLDSIVSAISNYLNESGIYGKVNIYIRNGKQAVAVTLGSSVDVEKVQAFVKEKGLDSSYISYFADDYSGEMLLEKEVHAINYAASISTYMTENGIKGYIYQKQDCDILVVVCKTNEGISSVKSFAKEHGFKAELLEYTLPDFEIEAPAIAPTDLEEIRQILDEFIKQNGLNGYTTIRPRKGEDKVWVMLDSVKDEYTRKIEYFLSEYGIDLNSVIVDTETSATGEPIVVGNTENTTEPIVVENSENTTEPVVVEHSEEKEELLMNVRADIEGFIIENNIKGYTYDKHGSDIIMIVCNTNEEIEQVKAFVANKGYRTDKLEYTLPDFEVNAPDIAPTDLEEIRQILDDFIKQNDLNGYTIIRPRKGEDKVWVMLDSVKDENYRKIELFMDLYGIDSDSVIIDGEVTNASEPVVVEHSDDKDEPIMHVAASISTFMEENSIEGYIYQKQDSEVLVIVCKTNDGISQVKSFVADKGYRTDRLEYTLPDFEVNPPAQLSGNLEDYRQVIDEFIKQNGISGYTKIADYKGEEKIWVILDTLTDEYTRKIEFFIAQYGIDKNSVIIDTEVTNPTQNNTNITSDDEFAQWAIKDYQDKTGVTAASAEVKPISDDKYEIVLKDADGNILDTYTINPETGIGTDSSHEAVDLPQTGNNSTRNLLTAIGAVLMLAFGAVAVKFSGVLNRRNRNEK